MVHYNQFHSSPWLKVEFIRRTGCRISVRATNQRLLTAGYPSRRPTTCPGLTREHHRRRRHWAQRHPVWDLRHWGHCVFYDESRFKQCGAIHFGRVLFLCRVSLCDPFTISLIDLYCSIIFIMIVVTIIGSFMAILFILNNTFRLSVTR